ncbi:MAG TPA: hypothetical protein VFQ35_22405 [Polyangiaceae bacterium]|nr:hypothetical protein [Polyangiaceae bacterium]
MNTKLRYAFALCALLAACSGSSASDDSPSSTSSFVAFANDFKGYHSWQSFDVSAEAKEKGIHDGTVIEYVNQLPASGSTEYPLGTLVVKEAIGGAMGNALFAMARRGGNYNSTGVRGWEWFELENLATEDDSVKIIWRGFGPPIGEEYGGDPNSTCNTCHKKCVDAVCSTPLALENF